MSVAITRARHRHVDGEHQRGGSRFLRSRQHFAHEAAIANHIQLKPDRRRTALRDFLDGADRHRRQRERHAGVASGACRLQFAAPRAHAGDADRAERHRHRQLAAEQRRARSICETSRNTRWRNAISLRSLTFLAHACARRRRRHRCSRTGSGASAARAARRKSLVEARIMQSPAVAREREPFLCCVARSAKQPLSATFSHRAVHLDYSDPTSPTSTPGRKRGIVRSRAVVLPTQTRIDSVIFSNVRPQSGIPVKGTSEYQNRNIIYQNQVLVRY